MSPSWPSSQNRTLPGLKSEYSSRCPKNSRMLAREEPCAKLIADFLRRVARQECRERFAVDVLHRQHAARRKLLVDVGTITPSSSRKAARASAQRCSLVLVVGLGLEHFLDVGELGVQAVPVFGQAKRKEQAAEIADVAADRACDARILHLDGHFLARRQPSPVDLTQRGRCKRLGFE